tara:strand:+ start:365 stop:655 length:291 start_codon:yes stop_codon:yes gene_type:complete
LKTLINFLLGYFVVAILISLLAGDAATGLAIALILGIYFLPDWIAQSRGHPNRGSIFILNLFLGWTFLGWVAALIWANSFIDKGKRQKTALDVFKK